MTTMFLDDCRNPRHHFDIICRSVSDAKIWCNLYGIPNFISFDHDLDMNETGYDFAWWLINESLDGKLTFPEDFSFFVHSANPVGKQNITSLLNNFLHKETHNEIC